MLLTFAFIDREFIEIAIINTSDKMPRVKEIGKRIEITVYQSGHVTSQQILLKNLKLFILLVHRLLFAL